MKAGGLSFGAVWFAMMLAAPVSAQESVPAPESVSAPVPAPVPAPASVSARVSAPAPAPVLLAPVQGTASLRARDGARVTAAVRRGLEAHGHHAPVSQDLLGRTLVACQTPECIEQALDAAGAAFGIVPAIWARANGEREVTLTLLQRSGRSLNATGTVGDDLAGATVGLVEGLLARRAEAVAGTGTAAATGTGTAAATGTATATRRPRPHAWKAGPILLVAGGTGAIVAIGAAAGVKSDNQQLNSSAVAAWAAVGAAAIGGGVAWWLVGAKRRRNEGASRGALAPELALHPTKIDLTLRF